MADITITGKVAERLQQLAQDKHQTIEEIIEEALGPYVQNQDKKMPGGEPPPSSLARIARLATRNPIEVAATDIAERSRDILCTEYTEHLLKRGATTDDASHE
jgi:hypothetical protein